MKPVVSSLVALAIAIVPLAAMASSPEKSAHGKATIAKVVKHKKVTKTEKSDTTDVEEKSSDKAEKSEKIAKAEKVEKADKNEKSEKVEKTEKSDKAEKMVVRVKHTGKKPVLHHAHGVEMGGGHQEPKIEHGVSVIPASLTTRAAHAKGGAHISRVSHETEMPKLPNPNAQKPGAKNAAEKGARKASEKKHDGDSSASDGQTARDEEAAELVAHNRGQKGTQTDAGEEPETKADTKAEAKHERAPAKGKQAPSKPTCTKEPVEIIRGPEIDKFELTTCDGSVAPLAIEHLSILVRPGSAARPTAPIAELAKRKGPELAKGIRRVDPRLVERVQAVVDHFAKGGTPPKLSIISGYRPTSVGSTHATGRAVDFRLDGVKNEDVIAFCKTLGDTGCGFYPNSSFVHLDVRDSGAGHVSWIDASGPGEAPHYVTMWPVEGAKREARNEALEPASLKAPAEKAEKTDDRDSASEPAEEHSGDTKQ